MDVLSLRWNNNYILNFIIYTHIRTYKHICKYKICHKHTYICYQLPPHQTNLIPLSVIQTTQTHQSPIQPATQPFPLYTYTPKYNHLHSQSNHSTQPSQNHVHTHSPNPQLTHPPTHPHSLIHPPTPSPNQPPIYNPPTTKPSTHPTNHLSTKPHTHPNTELTIHPHAKPRTHSPTHKTTHIPTYPPT